MGYLSDIFSEDEEEIPLCNNYILHGVCSRRGRNQHCHLRHDTKLYKEAREIDDRSRKLCPDFINQGFCELGKRCPNKHSSDLRQNKVLGRMNAKAATIELKEEAKRIISDVEKNFPKLQAMARIPWNGQLSELLIRKQEKERAVANSVEKVREYVSWEQPDTDFIDWGWGVQTRKEDSIVTLRIDEEESPTIASARSRRPRKTCKYFIKGCCKFGARCLDLHDKGLRQKELKMARKDVAKSQIQTPGQPSTQDKATATKALPEVQPSVHTIAQDNSAVTQTQPGVQKPREKPNKKNKKNKKVRSGDDANVVTNTADNIQATDPVTTATNADEHSWVEKDNYWVERKRVNSKWSKSTKNFPALPQATKKSENENTTLFTDMTLALPLYNTLSSIPARKNFNQTNTKTAPWTTKALTTTNRQNDLGPSNFPPLSLGKPTKRTQTTWALSKPMKVPKEHLIKDNKPKNALKQAGPWNKNEDIILWAHDNLTPKTRDTYLARYFSTQRQRSVTKPYLAVQEKTSCKGKGSKTSSINLPDLPPELRIQIWKLVLNYPKGQTVRLKHYLFYDENDRVSITEFRSMSLAPALLHVNRETRMCAQVHYELAFGTPTTPALTYFNFNTDKVFLHTQGAPVQTFIDDMLPKDLARVKTVAISIKDWVSCKSERALCNQLSRFSTCRSLLFVAGEGKLEMHWTKDKKFPRYVGGILAREWYKTHQYPIERPPGFKFRMVDIDTARDWQIDNLKW